MGQLQKEADSNKNGFVLQGTLKSALSDKVYLSKITGNDIQPVDSAKIENNNFVFQGIVEHPERFFLSFENSSTAVIFIVENTNFEIFIDPDQMEEPVIKGSELNTKLLEYKLASKNIFKKIDYLFPKFQKARLENDVIKLDEVGNELKQIESEFTDFSYNFIKNNSDSYVAAMVLSDQLKSTTVDTLRITNAYKLLSEEVKKSPDAQLIATALGLGSVKK
jgi:DNA-binding transcriptional regulator of glucitol operon